MSVDEHLRQHAPREPGLPESRQARRPKRSALLHWRALEKRGQPRGSRPRSRVGAKPIAPAPGVGARFAASIDSASYV